MIIAKLLLALLPTTILAQKIDLQNLRDRCLPEAPMSTLSAIILTESGGNASAIGLDFPKTLYRRLHLPPGTVCLKRQPSNRAEAAQWLAYFVHHNIPVDVGLMQVSTIEASRRKVSPQDLLDSCHNIRAGWSILQDAYKIEVHRYGPGQAALQHAISRYNTGDTNKGINNGYVGRILSTLERQPNH